MEAIQPLLDLLGGNAKSTLATGVAWFFAIRFALVFVHGIIQRFAADRLNAVAASSSKDDDEFLLTLFQKPWYRGLVVFGLLIGFPLPSLADLERAIRLQQEAAAKAQPVPVAGTRSVAGLFLIFALSLGLLGCVGPQRLETGGAYAPALTNAVGEVTATAAPDLTLFLLDASYDFAYQSALTACRIEQKNRALLAASFPRLKSDMDKFRQQIWETDLVWATARQAYLTNPVPANLEPIHRAIAEMERWNAAATALIPKASP
ncbi:MAG: hypothetical protein E6R03_16540 [Hyphomicrobiaceae bacterium]|nr:MAG: hypothetical protein E6R03_16540 [Hyphomicrobiaceae bacterium]